MAELNRIAAEGRPIWCPHPSCTPVRSAQGSVCGGRLPAPESHGQDFNTHRLCIRTQPGDLGSDVFDLQVNATDLWWLGEMIIKPLREDAKITYQQARAERGPASDPK